MLPCKDCCKDIYLCECSPKTLKLRKEIDEAKAQLRPERKVYLAKLIKAIRQDFLRPVEVIDGEPMFDGKYLDIALLCDVIEEEVL